jgi:hypothetical protein
MSKPPVVFPSTLVLGFIDGRPSCIFGWSCTCVELVSFTALCRGRLRCQANSLICTRFMSGLGWVANCGCFCIA